jgi:energy-coupling factor transporter transmembrane protein EcfT
MQQNQDVSTTVNSNAVTLCRKSIAAYLGIIVRVVIITALFIAALYWKSALWKPVTLIWVVAASLIIYRWMLIRSFHLYYDDIGVWLYSGILPWKRGVVGVKWRDLDEAVFTNNFASWLTQSYAIVIRHRFTKESEIVVTQMADGKQAVITINQQLQERIRKGIPLS